MCNCRPTGQDDPPKIWSRLLHLDPPKKMDVHLKVYKPRILQGRNACHIQLHQFSHEACRRTQNTCLIQRTNIHWDATHAALGSSRLTRTTQGRYACTAPETPQFCAGAESVRRLNISPIVLRPAAHDSLLPVLFFLICPPKQHVFVLWFMDKAHARMHPTSGVLKGHLQAVLTKNSRVFCITWVLKQHSTFSFPTEEHTYVFLPMVGDNVFCSFAQPRFWGPRFGPWGQTHFPDHKSARKKTHKKLGIVCTKVK